MRFRDDYLQLLRSCLAEESEWHRVERCFRKGLGDEEDVEDARLAVRLATEQGLVSDPSRLEWTGRADPEPVEP